MRTVLLTVLLFPIITCYTQSVSGLYAGRLVNDSTKKVQTYELGLSEYRGKITGYSYTTFVSHDTFYYSIKRIHAIRKDNQLVVEDDKMIVNNFPESPAKHVHQINYIPLHANEDTVRNVNGSWATTRTKFYYSIHGIMDLKRDGDSTHSALINHLKELGIVSQEDQHIASTKEKINDHEKKIKQKNETVAAPPGKAPALPYNLRKNNLMQTIDVQSDSLYLSFYDNGVIDGDSISVYVNGVNVVSNSRLLAVATKKTISIKNLGDDIQLLVVAENLGTIPPNTGLVVISDGEQTFQVNFTADMQTNATIALHRKKK